MRYTLLVSDNVGDLSTEVNDHLLDGWRLSGVHQCAIAIQCAPDHPMEGVPYCIYTQAMTKD